MKTFFTYHFGAVKNWVKLIKPHRMTDVTILDGFNFLN